MHNNSPWLQIISGGFFSITVLKPARGDTLNRRSWESSKLSSQVEEEETAEAEQAKLEETASISSSKSLDQPKKEDKESMFSKLKNFRKG